jgi:hypothetical protein
MHRAQNLYAKQTVTDRKRLQEFSFFRCHTRLQDPVSSACFDTEIRKHPNVGTLYIYICLLLHRLIYNALFPRKQTNKPDAAT